MPFPLFSKNKQMLVNTQVLFDAMDKPASYSGKPVESEHCGKPLDPIGKEIGIFN
jgi:hypothetical protein